MTHRHENEPTMTVQESNAGAGSRWGVQLKKTATRTCSASNTTPRDSRTVQLVKNQRASLRHVSVPRRPQRRRSRSSSISKKRWRCGGWKTRKAHSGSTGTPLLGVALKPFPLKTIQEDEEGDFDFVDLRLLGEPSPEDEVPNGSNFAVRRKPGPRRARARRQSSHSSSKSSTISSGSATQKTYQIDLDPDQEWHNGKDKSYLEVKARAIQKEQQHEQLLPQEEEQQPQDDDELESTSDHMRSLKVTHHPELDKVELELRHVVAPADGGPRKIVTEAVFEVPLCKPVKPLVKHASGEQCDHEHEEPPELLQISIQNLQSDAVQLVLKQVDPDTREVHDMDNLIDVKLEKKEPPKGWTMAVGLQEAPLGDSDRWGNAADNDQALPSSSCHSSNPRRTIVQKRVRFNLGDEDELDEEYDGNGSIHHITLHNSFTPDSLHSKLEISSLSVLEDSADWWESENSKANAPKRPTRCHSPEPGGKRCPCRDESCKMPRRSSDHHHHDDVEVVVRDELRVASSHSIPFPTAELIEDDSDSDDDDDSSASSSSDEDSDSDDEDEDDDDMDPMSRKKELTLQAKRDLLTLYARMGCPTMQQMKDRVAKMASPLEPEDVEMMPWLAGGRFMNVRAMNQLYIDGVNDL